MNTYIAPSRVHRVVGAKMVAGRWNAQVKHQPMKVVTRSRLVRTDWAVMPAIVCAIAATGWMILCFYWIFRLTPVLGG